MKTGDVILWNGKPHKFSHFTTARYGRNRIEAVITDGRFYFGIDVKDAFNKMESQILTTL